VRQNRIVLFILLPGALLTLALLAWMGIRQEEPPDVAALPVPNATFSPKNEALTDILRQALAFSTSPGNPVVTSVTSPSGEQVAFFQLIGISSGELTIVSSGDAEVDLLGIYFLSHAGDIALVPVAIGMQASDGAYTPFLLPSEAANARRQLTKCALSCGAASR
jgi:hypothetical protein